MGRERGKRGGSWVNIWEGHSAGCQRPRLVCVLPQRCVCLGGVCVQTWQLLFAFLSNVRILLEKHSRNVCLATPVWEYTPEKKVIMTFLWNEHLKRNHHGIYMHMKTCHECKRRHLFSLSVMFDAGIHLQTSCSKSAAVPRSEIKGLGWFSVLWVQP